MPISQPRILNWKVDEKPSTAKLEECFANLDIQICDLDPSDNEMHMLYMMGVQYIRPIQPSVSRDGGRKKRRMERSVAGTSGGSGGPCGKRFTTVLKITYGRIDARIVNEGDDDFADTPPMWRETHMHMYTLRSGRVRHLDRFMQRNLVQMSHRWTTKFIFQTVHIKLIKSYTLLEIMQAVEQLRKELTVQMSELISKNDILTVQMVETRSHLTSTHVEQMRKIDDIMQKHNGIRSGMLEIRTNMQFMCESITTLISSTMEEVLRKHDDISRDNQEGPVVKESEKPAATEEVSPSMDKKCKSKMNRKLRLTPKQFSNKSYPHMHRYPRCLNLVQDYQ